MPPEIRGDGGCFYSYCIANDSLVGAFGTVCRRRFVIFWSTNAFCAVRTVVDAVVFADAAPFRQRGQSKGLWRTPSEFFVNSRHSMDYVAGKQRTVFCGWSVCLRLKDDYRLPVRRIHLNNWRTGYVTPVCSYGDRHTACRCFCQF
jgi:hypothetical protein